MAVNLCTRPSFRDKLKHEMCRVLNSSPSLVTRGGGGLLNLNKGHAVLPMPDKLSMFTAYKLDGCPYSEEAGALLQSLPNTKSVYVYRDLGTDKNEVMEFLHDNTTYDKYKHRTFPIIFKGDSFIGGYQELKQHMKNALITTHVGGSRISNVPRLKFRLKKKSIKAERNKTKTLVRRGRKSRM